MTRAQCLKELELGDGLYYVTQERAMAPGIVTGWPDVIRHPMTKHGRLVKRQWPMNRANRTRRAG